MPGGRVFVGGSDVLPICFELLLGVLLFIMMVIIG